MSRWALLAVVLAAGVAGAAEPPPAGRAAVDRGVGYLRQRFANGLAGGTGGADGHGLGEAALAGLAMLEGGAPTTDPTVLQIATTVRQGCLPDTHTYHIALCILFLDRLAEPGDRGVIQVLGVKLYIGLLATGGWTYHSGDPLGAHLLASLQENQLSTKPAAPKGGDKGGGGFVKPTAPKGKADPPPTGMHPLAEQLFRAAQSQIRASGGRKTEPGDNSNTQFGLIGLWVAGRNGLPADDAFPLIERRFLSSQNRDAGWSYTGAGEGGSTPAMTCAGLLGLAVGAGKGSTTPPDRRKPAGPGDGFVPAAPKKEPEGGNLEGVKNKRAVQAALAALAAVVRGSGGQLGKFVGIGNEYYLLWSVERVCMAYNLADLGGADWYQWGCDFLLPAQQSDGSWPSVGLCSADVDTAFAILFLMRSNVVSDLSTKLGGQERSLRAGGADLPPAMTAPRQDPAPKGAAPLPPDEALVAAGDADFVVKLAALRDAKGGENTQAIAKAIPRLPADRQSKARTALAERLTRMTAATLRGMFKDGSEEVKRAAATAAAGKGDKTLAADLVPLLADPSDPLVQAVRSALKALTGQDHGPPPGADAAAKAKAQEAWRAAIN